VVSLSSSRSLPDIILFFRIEVTLFLVQKGCGYSWRSEFAHSSFFIIPGTYIYTSSISRLIIPTPALCSSSDLQRFFIFSGVTELVLECIESSFLRVLANLTPGARLTTLNWRAFCDRWWRRVAPRDPIVHYSC